MMARALLSRRVSPRSPNSAVALELGEETVQRRDWAPRDRAFSRARRYRQPSVPNGFRQDRVLRQHRATLRRRNERGDDTFAVRDEHGLARGDDSYVLSQPVLQDLQADDAHLHKVVPSEARS
jgi:hypothetical protein